MGNRKYRQLKNESFNPLRPSKDELLIAIEQSEKEFKEKKFKEAHILLQKYI